MNVFCGIDLGSTTTKAVLLDHEGLVLGRGITNSRSNYSLAADIARDEAFTSARFTLIDRELSSLGESPQHTEQFRKRLLLQFRRQQLLSQLKSLRDLSFAEIDSPRYDEIRSPLSDRLRAMFDSMEDGIR
ncbi:MAG TPA: BadF/BadG/BcrA/BcrD ATPase family protein, partial [Pseudomonadota bacterium]|nr:BadF/BadG/BcrA/BcrD ATPase family protein [Pseudomonadota bacterium]